MNYRIGRLTEHILENLKQPWSVSEMARWANLSGPRLQSLFKKETKLTPIQFLTHHRLEKAKELLENTNLKVREVIAEVGFFDPSHFSREFKKAYGRNPEAHRQFEYDESRANKTNV